MYITVQVEFISTFEHLMFPQSTRLQTTVVKINPVHTLNEIQA